ncbi:hypothetical protein KV580_22125 [Pseudomonas chlororaphis]|nr:hypothetical protein [Pseudomonas chlororaphis]
MNTAVRLPLLATTFNAEHAHPCLDEVEEPLVEQTYFSVCAPLPGLPAGNRAPYGICGPFLDEQEAIDALWLLRAKRPGIRLALIMGRMFFDAAPDLLSSDQEKARAKLSDLLKAE